ncbi:carbon storage regulator CsrA [Cohnella sp. CFH 77786]|uniref:carbon storage regulator CsrA n=1 Tax=Cohnella sp. CFH 77786 TaxID=2662265 RepID=UPI001C60EE07|nr:carbon storage regulator CsrA [Cohnella sp. CFH 77786]MBW5448474.1 carbon storage regulator CsrA [Cohnella sp. CFH 77786]
MLILSRKKGQSIIIDENIEIVVVSVEGEQVKIGINAPPQVKIFRSEVLESIRESNKAAIASPQQLSAIKGLASIVDKKNKPME